MHKHSPKAQADAEYLQWQYNQLNEAQLLEGEMQELEQEEYRLAHAEDIQASLAQALLQLDSDNGALSLIHSTRIADVESSLAERLDAVEIELKDIIADIQRLYDRTERDPMRLEQVQDRISTLQTLMKKHRVSTVEQLIEIRDDFAKQVERIENIDEDIARLQTEADAAHNALSIAAEALTASRLAPLQNIALNLEENMVLLGVPHAKVKVDMQPTAEFTETGKDNIQFLFAANLNQSLRRVAEVASEAKRAD